MTFGILMTLAFGAVTKNCPAVTVTFNVPAAGEGIEKVLITNDLGFKSAGRVNSLQVY